MDFGIILAAPAMLVIGIPLGFMGLFTSFGILYALPSIALVISAIITNNYGKMKAASLLVLTAVIGQWSLLLSWIVSRHSIEASEATRQWGTNLPSVAKAGFPFSALELPQSPMGSDSIPMDMWAGVFTNELVWFAVAFIVTAAIVSKKKNMSKKLMLTCIILTAFGVIYNLALFALWYD